MEPEDKSKNDEQRIKKLIEEAAKRHREINQKIHSESEPEKSVSDSELVLNVTPAEESGSTESTTDSDDMNSGKESIEENVKEDEQQGEKTKNEKEKEELNQLSSLTDSFSSIANAVRASYVPENRIKEAIEQNIKNSTRSEEPEKEAALTVESAIPSPTETEDVSSEIPAAREELPASQEFSKTLTEAIIKSNDEKINRPDEIIEHKEELLPEVTSKADESIINAKVEEASRSNPEESYISDFDLYLFSQGTFYKIFEKFGAHKRDVNGINGVQFTTWAPNAKELFVIGEFCGWQEKEENRLNKIGDSGVWTGFIAGIASGDTYKYSISSYADNELRKKADPYAFHSELRPKNASLVADISGYSWKDEKWMSERTSTESNDTGKSNPNSFKQKPMNIYEVHLGSWRRDYINSEHPNEWGYLSYAQLAHEIVNYVKRMGYTHIELMPVMEHPLDISWGYQVTSYYAPTSRFGSPHDFMYFVDHCHRNNIGVILDWVPAHFPYDEHSLAYFDGKQIYAYENIKRGIHKDWGTYIFDYGKPEVQNFLIGSALFWLEKYHIDGLRVDAVASMLYLDYSREQGEWEPNIHGGREHLEAIGFLKHLNEKVHEYHKGAVMIAEESTSWPGVSHPVSEGGLGFDMKWNMGWMNDILLYFSKDPVYRKFHQGKLTFSLWYAFSENFVLPISHDEVVHGKKSLLEKMPGDNWQKFANLRLFFGFMTGHPGKKLNFMSNDIAQYNEWNSEVSLEWQLLDIDLNAKLNKYAADLNELYKTHPSLSEVDFDSSGFRWIDFSDSLHSVLSFIRIASDRKEILLFTFNMTPTVRYDYPVGVPEAGYWKEILNSDADIYGGSGIGNMGGKESEPVPYKEWQNSIRVTLPPLAVNVYKLEKK